MIFPDRLFKETGAQSFGVLPFDWLEESMDEGMVKRKERLCPWAKSVVSFTFPYFCGGAGNLAAFSRGRDYHFEIKERLLPVCAELEEMFPENRFTAFSDDAPFLEVLAACFSGAGILGRNGLIACQPFGNYVMLGEIVTDAPFDHAETKKIGSCKSCLKCESSCPTGAMTIENGRRVLDRSKCIAAITQKKGDLTFEEADLLRKSHYIWGCDECLKVCPKSAETHAPRFERIDSLSLSNLEGLSDDEFKKKFPERSFTWRGVEPLLRNLRLLLNNIENKQE
ncbi:MAG: DUF1730 domain-containing protein [Bacillota bacterium]|nr:DUF1730 domain-containing protein [Bacillota bacterium]